MDADLGFELTASGIRPVLPRQCVARDGSAGCTVERRHHFGGREADRRLLLPVFDSAEPHRGSRGHTSILRLAPTALTEWKEAYDNDTHCRDGVPRSARAGRRLRRVDDAVRAAGVARR